MPPNIVFGDFHNIKVADYCITITIEYREKLIFSMLRKVFELFVRYLRGITNQLSEKAQPFVLDVYPDFTIIAAPHGEWFVKNLFRDD